MSAKPTQMAILGKDAPAATGTSHRNRHASVVGGSLMKRVSAFLDRRFQILFLLPGLLCLVGVVAYPVAWNLVAAFTNASLVYEGWRFTGFGNFRVVLSDPEFVTSALRTLVWTSASVALQLVVGLIAALCLEKVTAGRSLLRMALIVPWAFPAIIMAFAWRYMLDASYGVANYVLMVLGLIGMPHAWLGETGTAMAALIAMNVWFGFPFMMVAFIAGLQTIPRELYEAASIDGASPWQEFRHVTLPGLKSIVATLATLRTIWTFNNFEFPYLTTGGGPVDATTTLPIYAFKVGWTQYELGRMAAVSVLMLAILAVTTALYLRLLREDADA
ncbi:carbohydrate ABC transporter permease [Alsobacter sp. SYSU BS001988]